MKHTLCKYLSLMLGLSLFGCSRATPVPRTLNMHQNWPISIGTEIAGYAVSSGLGDISLDLSGDTIHMPFDGTVEPTATSCVIVSSADVPAYLFRLCGLSQPKFGALYQHQPIGRAQHLVFAMLRREPNGTWAIVEPSPTFIEQLLTQS
ncbi:MAG: hypothetical protein KTR27_10105 [Leptolyngbyaceae cyanobacterium MAG.088]|nr:hypothetical protein [Leptolyngbyaceae cyanobacterium MAG.088]